MKGIIATDVFGGGGGCGGCPGVSVDVIHGNLKVDARVDLPGGVGPMPIVSYAYESLIDTRGPFGRGRYQSGTPGIGLRALDSYGNRSDGYRGTVSFEGLDVEPYTFNEDDRGAHRFSVALGGEGLKTLKVVDSLGHAAESNPITILRQEPRYKLYWGDFHRHTGNSIRANVALIMSSLSVRFDKAGK